MVKKYFGCLAINWNMAWSRMEFPNLGLIFWNNIITRKMRLGVKMEVSYGKQEKRRKN